MALPTMIVDVARGMAATRPPHGGATSYLDALDHVARAFDATRGEPVGARLRLLADVAELPVGVRPTPRDGAPNTRLGTFVHEDDRTWADAARSLRALAADVDAGNGDAAMRADFLLGPHLAPKHGNRLAGSQAATDDVRFLVGMREVHGAAEPGLLPEQLPGQEARTPYVARRTPPRIVRPERAGGPPMPEVAGQLALGSEQLARSIAEARAGARLLGSRDPAELHRLTRALAKGREVAGSGHAVGDGKNKFGQLQGNEYEHRGTRAAGVVKPRSAGAAQEDFAWRVIAMVRADAHAPAVGRTKSGDVRIELRPGVTFGSRRLTDSSHVEGLLSRSLQQRHLVDVATADAAARFDAQVLRAVDYVLADSDRHAGNVMGHERGGTVSMIDRNFVGMGTWERGVPVLHPESSAFSKNNGSLVERLDPAVVEHLRRTLTPGGLKDAWKATLRDEPVATLTGPEAKVAKRNLRHVQRADYPREMAARLEHVLREGTLTWSK